MKNIIEELITILPTKIDEGLEKLKTLPIESEDFTKCLGNVLACNDLYRKIVYTPEEQETETKEA